MGPARRYTLGREDVKLAWQVAPLGTCFAITSEGVLSSTSASWVDVLTTGVVITQHVTGLTPETGYCWCVRLVQAASRWGWQGTGFRTYESTAAVITYAQRKAFLECNGRGDALFFGCTRS